MHASICIRVVRVPELGISHWEILIQDLRRFGQETSLVGAWSSFLLFFFEWLSLHVFSNICSEIVSIFLFRSANKLLFFVFLWLDKVSKMNDYSGCKICRNELSATEINLFTRAQNVDAKTIYFGISLGFDSWFTLPPNHGANSRCRPLLSLYPR